VGSLQNKKVFFLILIASLALLIVGLSSELYLGDEAYHYRFAKNMYYAGHRLAFDPIYGTGLPPGYFYNSDPFWNILLAFIWKVLGGVSFATAQIYHIFYYVLLILFTFLLGKEMGGEDEGFYAALIVATTPVVAAFGILFYIDVPVTALSVVFFYLAFKKKYFFSGLLLGLMYITKRNSWFLLPGVLIAVLFFQDNPGLKTKVKILAVIGITCLSIVLPDIYWRENNLKVFAKDDMGISSSGVGTIGGMIAFLTEKRTKEFFNSSTLSLFDFIKYLGIPLLAFMIAYFLFRRHRKKDIILWAPLLSYLTFFILFFGINSDIRYLLPIVPFLAILSGSIAVSFGRAWIKGLILLLCGLQLLSSSLYVYAHRKMPEGIRQGFTYIRGNTSPNALIMYPEYIFLEATERKFVWIRFQGLGSLFWRDDQKMIEVLERNRLDYILIKKSRVYNDMEERHFGGYPHSFVMRLPQLPFMERVFANDQLELWKVNLKPKN
jgi:4-amino-4-deoxy-L-arabinose transferase-like glycosyltransferase